MRNLHVERHINSGTPLQSKLPGFVARACVTSEVQGLGVWTFALHVLDARCDEIYLC